MDQISDNLAQYAQLAFDYLSQPKILIQLGIIGAALPIAWLLSNRVEPMLEARARKIKGMPGLLRVIIAFLRRFEWLFFIILLGSAYVGTSVVSWPDSNYLIYAILLLSSAWLLISVVSHTIRKRTVRTIG